MSTGPIFLSDDVWRNAVSRFRLSPREADIAASLLNGLSVRQTADFLAIRPETVRTYVKRLHDKTNARNSLALVRAIMATGEPASD